MSKKTLIVVGNGMVGHHFLEQLVASPAAAEYDILVFGEEKQLAYDRVHLSEYFAGSTHADLAMGTSDWYTEQGIQLLLNEPVTGLDRDQRTVTTPKGDYNYDELVLATGSYPFVPPIEGREHPHCFVYRTLEDLDAIRASAQAGKSGVVVGGGLLGLEAANALKSLGLQAHVVEFAPRLMPVQLDTDGGALLRHKIEELGVQVHTEKATTAIVAGEEARLRMNFNDDSHLETDLIVFSAGIRPQDALARSSGLEVGERGGIVVNDQCTTSDPHIHAIGECALWDQRIFGLVAPGYTMARTLASVLNGDQDAAFTGADMSTKLKLLGVDVGSIGDAHGQTPGARNIRFNDEQVGHYRRMVVSENGKKLLGAILVGDNSHYDTLLQYALNGIALPDNPETLILPESQGGAPALGPDALPETASICSCHNVTKGDICGAIDAGCGDLGSVKAETKASTGCGGCTALLKNVVDSELEKRGVEVS
ncbi:nitrite reductase large subunit NirB, partial [Marinobacter alexandrii]